MAEIGETCQKRYLFTAGNIASVATAIGDTNPVHHDAAMAAATRFGGIIASAGHSTGLFISVLADHFSKSNETYALEFSYRLRRAVPSGLDAVMRWRVVGKKPSTKLNGDLVEFEGELLGDDGCVYVEGKATILIVWQKRA